jgi:hypothetical protein
MTKRIFLTAIIIKWLISILTLVLPGNDLPPEMKLLQILWIPSASDEYIKKNHPIVTPYNELSNKVLKLKKARCINEDCNGKDAGLPYLRQQGRYAHT